MRLKPSGNTTSASADPRVVACPFLPYPVLLPPAFPKNCSYRNDQSLFHRTWAETKENVSRLTLPCAVAILISIFPRAALSQACPDTARKDSGRLCATLAISQGHWTVQPQGLTLRRGTLPAGITEAQVRDSLQAAVQEAEFPYRLGLDAEGRAKDDTQPVPELARLRTFSGTWVEYATAAIAAGIDATTLIDNVSGFLATLKKSTAFVTPDRDTFAGETGAVQLDVVAFTSRTPIRVAGAGQSPQREKSLQGYLNSEADQLWRTKSLLERINKYYSYLGLEPTVEADPGIGAIEIVEGTRIQQINLPAVGNAAGEIKPQERLKALYSLLDDRDFRLFLRKKIDRNEISYSTDLERRPGEEPFFSPVRAQIQQLWLAQSNLALTTVPGTTVQLPAPWTLPQQYVGIRVLKPAPEAPESPAETPAAANDDGLITPSIAETGDSGDRGIDLLREKEKPTREKHNFVGATFTYKPGQGVSVGAIYQLSNLSLPFMDNSVGVRVDRPTDHGVTPSINYAADYIFFDTIKRRLSFQLNGASRFTNNRFLDGAVQDETREGGMGRIEFELFRDRDGSLLRFHVEGGKHTVTRTVSDQPEIKNKLTALNVGTLFMTESWETIHPWRLMIAPVMRWGLALSGDPSFARFDVVGDAHVQFNRGYAFDFSASFRRASSATPVFELPSLGGPESVRGFQADDAIGRGIWSAQNEFWMPIPFLTNVKGGSGDFFRKMVRLALFADVAGVQDASSGSLDGTRAGAGMGGRLQFGAVILKGDFAYGFGPQTISGSRGKFYFSVKTNLPF